MTSKSGVSAKVNSHYIKELSIGPIILKVQFISDKFTRKLNIALKHLDI